MGKATRLPPLHALAAFEAAARLGGFTQAAEELCITPSAISHRMRQLESFLGEPLFERTGTGVRLNHAGQKYQQIVAEAFGQLTRLTSRQATQSARLTVGVPPTFARNLLIPALPDFYRQWPEIEIEVDIETPLAERPARHDIDVRWGTSGTDNRTCTKLFDDKIVALAAPAYRADRGLVTPPDLVRAELLRTRLLPWRPWLEGAALNWPEPTGGLQFADLGILLEAAASGLGVAACTTRLAAAWVIVDRLVTLFDVAVLSPFTYWIEVDAPALHRFEVAAFRDWLVAALA